MGGTSDIMNFVKVKRLFGKARLPEFQTEQAAGADLFACFDDPHICIHPGSLKLIPCGISIELPTNFEAQIRPRSGLALKHGVTVLNSPGTIDSDYRGEVKVLLINHGHDTFVIKSGERIAQMVVAHVPPCAFEPTEEFTETERGSGGFGSTG